MARLGKFSRQFAHIPRGDGCIYLAELSNGMVKVGFSNCIYGRLVALAREWAKCGVTVQRVETCFDDHPKPTFVRGYAREQKAIQALASNATAAPGRREYFRGLSFDQALPIFRAATRPALATDKVGA